METVGSSKTTMLAVNSGNNRNLMMRWVQRMVINTTKKTEKKARVILTGKMREFPTVKIKSARFRLVKLSDIVEAYNHVMIMTWTMVREMLVYMRVVLFSKPKTGKI